MTLLFAAYGVCLVPVLVLAFLGRLDEKPAYAGHHRAQGRTTRRKERQIAAQTQHSRENYARFNELRKEREFPELVDVELAEKYAHNLGVGRYAHLRSDELETTAERQMRLLAKRPEVDLSLLRSPFGTPELPDVWDEAA